MSQTRFCSQRLSSSANSPVRALVLAVLLAGYGCDGTKMKPVKSTPLANNPSTATGKAPTDAARAVSQDRCLELLTSAVDTLQPNRLGISSTSKFSAERLNNWLSECGTANAKGTPGVLTDDHPWIQALPADRKQILQQSRVDSDDVELIRDCIIDRKATDAVTKDATDDLDRVMRLFYYVTRSVSLEPLRTQTPLAFTPYETLIFGRGTAEGRAWIFANMLRQLRIDAVVIQPVETAAAESSEPAKSNSTEPAKSESTEPAKTDSASNAATPPKNVQKPWLVGVLLNKQVYLFDMRLGWPVPSSADAGTTPSVRQPATLKEVQADDGLLRRLDLDVERPYPLHSSDLKTPRIEVISDLRLWSEQMRQLQSSLPPVDGRTVVIYDAVADVGGGRGVFTRVAEGGESLWSREQIALWAYPESCRAATRARTPIQTNEFGALWFPYDAPVSITINTQQMRFEGGEPGRSQLKTRIAQLTGEYSSAIKSYLAVQLAEYAPKMPLPQEVYEQLVSQARARGISLENVPTRYPVPQDIWVMHYRAAEDAKYWVAIAQSDLNEHRAAADSFAEYLKRYQQKGWWSQSAGVMHAIALAESNRLAEAVYAMTQALQDVPEDHPQRAGFELLQNRWRAVRKATTPEKTEAPK